jgi:hypothetical protein
LTSLATEFAAGLGLSFGNTTAAATLTQAAQTASASAANTKATQAAGADVQKGLTAVANSATTNTNKVLATVNSLTSESTATRVVFVVLGVAIVLIALFTLFRGNTQ